MKIMLLSTLIVWPIMIYSTYIEGKGQAQLPGPPREGDERLIAPLVNSGIALNPTSLIQALKNEDLLIAGRAALALSRFPKTREIVEALNTAVKDKRESVAVAAACSLTQFKERAWADVAISRLPKLHDQVARIQLAGYLAQIGYAEGWPIVFNSVLDQQLGTVALENISFFDGLRDQKGILIKVRDELEKLLPKAPSHIRKMITDKINHLQQKSGR